MHPPSSPPSTTSSAIGLILARDKSVICSRFFRGGSCDVDNCPYAHFNATTELPMPESICYFHGKAGTTCKRDGCRFFHGSREAFESLKAAGATTYRPAWFLQVKDPVAGALESNPDAKDEEWQAVLKRVPRPNSQSKSTRGRPSRSSPPPSPQTVAQTSSSPIPPSSPVLPHAPQMPLQQHAQQQQPHYVQQSPYLPISPPSHVLLSCPQPIPIPPHLSAQGYVTQQSQPTYSYSAIPPQGLSISSISSHPSAPGVGMFMHAPNPTFSVSGPLQPRVGMPRY